VTILVFLLDVITTSSDVVLLFLLLAHRVCIALILVLLTMVRLRAISCLAIRPLVAMVDRLLPAALVVDTVDHHRRPSLLVMALTAMIDGLLLLATGMVHHIHIWVLVLDLLRLV
jgi:hypothetical protein